MGEGRCTEPTILSGIRVEIRNNCGPDPTITYLKSKQTPKNPCLPPRSGPGESWRQVRPRGWQTLKTAHGDSTVLQVAFSQGICW